MQVSGFSESQPRGDTARQINLENAQRSKSINMMGSELDSQTEINIVGQGSGKLNSIFKFFGAIGIIATVFLILSILFYALPKLKDQSVATVNLKIQIPSFDFDSALRKTEQQIQKVNNQQNQIVCLSYDDPQFHYQKYGNNMYYQTYYQILMPSCGRTIQNIQIWHKDRAGIQWALHTVQNNNKILYYRPSLYNLLEITILSRIIGKDGQLFIFDTPRSQCLNKILDLYKMPNNIKQLSKNDLKSFQSFDIIIANQTLFNFGNFSLKQKTKLLIYSKDSQILRQKQILKKFNKLEVSFEQGLCGDIIFKKNKSNEGIYSFTLEQKLVKQQIKRFDFLKHDLLMQIEQAYLNYKLQYKIRLINKVNLLHKFKSQSICIDPKANRTFADHILTIYGQKLKNVTLEQVLQWEEERHQIEWVRFISGQALNVYYEINDRFNLLTILQIAKLIGKDKITVVCQEGNPNCSKIAYQSIGNIKISKKSSLEQALLHQIIISDNEELIQKVIAEQFLQDTNNHLLGFFTNKRNQSAKALGKIYVNYTAKQIIIPHAKTECAGFEYLHYFWNSFNPHGFYQIKKFKYALYSYWASDLKDMIPRKRHILKELTTNQNVEVKIVSKQAFHFFEVWDQPIHPAVYLLTPNHQSDYFRGYMMHNYGGGYTDVKHIHFDWKPYFESFENQTKYIARGYSEKFIYHVACAKEDSPPDCKQVVASFARMIGNGLFLLKKRTPLTYDVFGRIKKNLAAKYEQLKKNPWRISRQQVNKRFYLQDGSSFVSKYPFYWEEMWGAQFARCAYKQIDKLLLDMPYVIVRDYRYQ